MSYQIKYTYKTGNSFGSHNEEGILEFTWATLELAKENLIRIKEHYEFYQATNYYAKNNDENIIKNAKTKDWYVSEYDFCLKLKTDIGKFTI